jgi:cyanophycin synthetase
VDVKRVVNQNASRDNESIVGTPHPSTVELGRRIVTSLGLELASVDLLTTHVSRPLAETGGVVNEVNTTPGLHHHYLVANPGRAPARDVLELLLERSGEQR